MAGATSVSASNGSSTSGSLPGSTNKVLPPLIISVKPDSGPIPGGNTVSIIGLGFTNATAVAFGPTPATSFTVASYETINAVVPPGPRGGGTVSVRVTGSQGISNTMPYTYKAHPVIDNATPNNGPPTGGNTVIITGSGFANATSVTFGSISATYFTKVSDTQIHAVVPPGSSSSTASVHVNGPGGISNSIPYIYAIPVINAISPTSGRVAGGNTVVITGRGLLDVTAVTFGPNHASFTIVSDTLIDAVAPPRLNGIGTVSVYVTGPGGITSNGIPYSYNQIGPVIGTISPTSGPVAGGNTVVITGSGFTNITAVTFGSNPQTSTPFTVVSSTVINAIVPPGPSGGGTVPIYVIGSTGISNGISYTYTQTGPVISSISPTSGPIAGGNTTIITGSGFTNATAVTFDSTSTSFTTASDTVINAIVPPGPSGGGTVSVHVTGPSGISNGISYTYTQTGPVIGTISPTSGPVAGGNTAIITGSGFTNATAVTFDSTSASFAIASDTVINAIVPPGPSGGGTVSVHVTGPSGISNGISYTYTQTGPVISSISPTSGPIAGGNTAVITGSGFTNATAVTFNSTSASFAIASDTVINAIVPPGPSGGGTVSVHVTGPSGISNGISYTYTQTGPVISSISPTSGPVAGGNTAIITGSGFTNATAVTFDSTSASFAIASDTVINAIVPPGPSGGGTVSVHVTGPSGISNGISYTYTQTSPVISSISPTSGPVAGGNTAVITGSGFTNATAVTFDSTSASFAIASDTVINAIVPPGPSGGGTVSVHVTGSSGTGTVAYTYALAPIVTGLTPAAGPIAGGNTVTITGSNFSNATAVTFDGILASSFAILQPTQIVAVAPPATAVKVASVVVTTPGGSSTPGPGSEYAYTTAPSTISVSPALGSTAGGDTVTIIGSGFRGTTSVDFGTTPATSFTVFSNTEINAITPAHFIGTVPIVITSSGGTNSTLSFSFVMPPVLTSIAPTSGSAAGGTVVSITGQNLASSLNVNFGHTAVVPTSIIDDNTVTAISPAGTAGVIAVTVTTAAGTSNGLPFIYVM
ncbi:hansenula MRAKII killer toxin-resistant protein 1 precursor, putative [Talaromyces stipitatus ATCC 10500]|uniref:Hansenula MRAKII killer toxin-resistant protein 1, putative n=1 Tax=Talaromyces stipitatus (strain ATCC 10500 / CBS 375.48 / QM 6759 / NRRL 1006) TaxID=441959 RepID=B8M939_TALSN|nr:hansenula MRAKII killer toxin-resistant protein 1 precursor, putative [Talaromyces stipitatus ATCC 10500]EED17334.1 hansenula MRAKII killer toxin-resistant protein 1 precursor, putative [Talaromyces stipitatus ATCC 10500]